MQTIRIPVEQIQNFMTAVFEKLGVPAEDAAICSEVLIASDLSGVESHGIGRLKMYVDRIRVGIQHPQTRIEVVRDQDGTAVWDGGDGMGHVVSFKAMQTAMKKAAVHGLGAVAVRTSTHFGICGYYARMAANENMIGLCFTNARPSIAPTFGTSPMLGTNPICFGAPTDLPYPFLYDAATSISQRGKIEVLDRAKKETPAGWAIDQNGEYMTDTPSLLKDLVSKSAALLPLGGKGDLMGGHKGYGLAVMVEILCAALQDGSFLHGLSGYEGEKRVPYRLGHFFVAIDIAHFIEPERFRKIAGSICRSLQSSQTAPGENRIFVAGEKEFIMEQEVRELGVPINPGLQSDLRHLMKELDLPENSLPI